MPGRESKGKPSKHRTRQLFGVAAAVFIGCAGAAGSPKSEAAAATPAERPGREGTAGQGRALKAGASRRSSQVFIPDYVFIRARRYEASIERAAVKYRVDPRLIWSVCLRESTFREGLSSPVGAGGLMQFMPGTAKRLGVNQWVADEAFDGAAKYLRLLLDMFGGDATKAVAAYNAGEIAVRGWSEGFSFRNHKGRLMNASRVKTADGLPPYEETRRYVRYVNAVWGSLDWSRMFSPRVLAAYRVSWSGAPAGGDVRTYAYVAQTGRGTVAPPASVSAAAKQGQAVAAAPVATQPRPLSRYYLDGVPVPSAAANSGSAYAPAGADGGSVAAKSVGEKVTPTGGEGSRVHRDEFSGETFVVTPEGAEKKRQKLSQVSVYFVGGEDE